jgi:hypothetical protein
VAGPGSPKPSRSPRSPHRLGSARSHVRLSRGVSFVLAQAENAGWYTPRCLLMLCCAVLSCAVLTASWQSQQTAQHHGSSSKLTVWLAQL